METPAQIDFQGMSANEHARQAITDLIAGLEDRFGRLTTCRVVLKGPGGRHRTGGLYEVNIRLGLPDGREVNVDRTAKLDERHADLDFALNDAFKRARRQLQDRVRQLQGAVKQRAEQPIGTVVSIQPVDGFGILQSADGREIYFHQNSVLDGAFARLAAGTRVAFAEEIGEKGPQASTVKVLGKHGMR